MSNPAALQALLQQQYDAQTNLLNGQSLASLYNNPYGDLTTSGSWSSNDIIRAAPTIYNPAPVTETANKPAALDADEIAWLKGRVEEMCWRA